MVFRKKTKKEQMVEARRKRQEDQEEDPEKKSSSSALIISGFFAIFVVIIVLICFVGRSNSLPILYAKQIAPYRIVADFSFQYTSEIATEELIEQRKQRVPPVYNVDTSIFESYASKVQKFLSDYDEYEKQQASLEATKVINHKELIRKHADQLGINGDDLLTLTASLDTPTRRAFFEESLIALRDLMNAGVYEAPTSSNLNSNSEIPFFIGLNTQRSSGNSMRTLERSLYRLRTYTGSLTNDPMISGSLFRVMQSGLQPNLIPDRDRWEVLKQQAAASVKPVVIEVETGQVIIQKGRTISAIQAEQYNTYRREVGKKEEYGFGVNALLLHQTLLTICIAATIYYSLKMALPKVWHSPRTLIMCSILLLANMGVLRLMQEVSETYIITERLMIADLFPYAAPLAVAAILVAVLIGLPAGIMMSLLVSIFNSLMHNHSFEVFAYTFLGCMTAMYYCRDIRVRAKIVKAGALSGLAVAVFVLVFGIHNQTETIIILQQIVISIAAGLATGILAIGVLPLMENTFRFTTEITLLELTDFNHPLLRRMQMVAPGSYHHSLMVANLSERAAAEIDANTLQCRVCALYHDIGKMVKPEYFTENQRDGINPHAHKNPSMSALVIKSHIKEGVLMAKQHKLPNVIINGIEQHHGTGLIWFFYHQSRKQRELELEGLHSQENEAFEESTYRYDGPKPQNKENAILLLADSVEAASRSLKKVSAMSIEELVNNIANNHINDGQFDEAPITYEEIVRVKRSLVITLINTLHARTEYPERENDSPSPEKKVSSDTDSSYLKRATKLERGEETESAI